MPARQQAVYVTCDFKPNLQTMRKKISLTILTIIIATLSFGQNIDSLKLNDAEIPGGYSKSNELLCKTPHAYSFYQQTDLYPFLGTVVKKDFQSFDKKRDKGSILYFQFDKDFDGQDFHNGLQKEIF
jgi:hypothetical protein